MEVTCDLFGPLREAVGRKSIERELSEDATVETLVADLSAAYDELEGHLFDEDGELADRLTITVNGRHIQQLDGKRSRLADGDRVRLAPPLVGG